MYPALSGSIPDQVGIFNKMFLPGTMRNGGIEPPSLVSVLNIPGLNPKSLRSGYVKAYVLLLAIRLSDRDVKPGGPMERFSKRLG